MGFDFCNSNYGDGGVGKVPSDLVSMFNVVASHDHT